MRTLALAALITVGIAGAAFAGPFTDPQGRINFTTPRAWQMDPPRSSNNQTSVLTFDGEHDCVMIGRVNSVTARSSPEAVIRTTQTPIAADAWNATTSSIRDFYPSGGARLASQTVDTSSGIWPIQKAQFPSDRGQVFAAMTSRPGVDLMAFCRALDGSDAAVFDSIFGSLSHPNDATWAAAYAEWQAQHAPPPATPPAQQPAPAPTP